MNNIAIICPTCGNPMGVIATEPSYDKKKKIAYQRTRFHCLTDDAWGRIEVPVGPMQDIDVQRIQTAEQ